MNVDPLVGGRRNKPTRIVLCADPLLLRPMPVAAIDPAPNQASLLSEADCMYTSRRAGKRRSEVFDGPTGAVPGWPA
jgi:hypothetical protein